MELDLRNRPLAATGRNARLWVERSDDLAELRKSMSMGFNVLVLADPGAGLTTFLNWFTADFEGSGRRSVRRSARRAQNAQAVLVDLAEALEQEVPRPPLKPAGEDGLDLAFQRLSRAAGATEQEVVVILDDVPGPLGHSLFGTLRDELWSVDLQWVVGGRVADEGLLLAPPADGFFETVHYLRPLTPEQMLDLLQRRDPRHLLSSPVRDAIATRARGNPAIALRLAREAAASHDPEAAVGRGTVIEAVASQLGQPAARLADELARGGATGPSDTDLLRRLGWSRPRAYQVFSQLEAAGFVTASEERNGQPGRPRKIYRLAGIA
jgi:hypothetical protein